ncbi:helix-turn-helix transcriptional regulator [candidate division WOR-3 bacterium]|nr:helix-turn-helix transcriptional regulator [candidate division WOR-3 bacterium]
MRLLREQAGLSQEAVATLMGLKGSGGKSSVCWVERGYLKYGPKFVRLLDFLRACGCGIEALSDVLDRYTSRETVPEEQASRGVLAAIETLPPLLARRAFYYHIGLTHKGRRLVRSDAAAAERVRRAVARGNSEWRQMRLQRELNNVLNELRIGWADTVGIHLRSYGRLVFATLRRLRKARPVWRERALEKLDRWPVEHGLEPADSHHKDTKTQRSGSGPEAELGPTAPFRRMKEAVMELFEEMVRSGAID